MDVQVLGPVEASVDGRSIPLGGGKPRALLAMLALNAGSMVSTERLIDGLWGEEPPASASKLVQVYVSQLRKALGSSAGGAEIVTRRHGYELRVQPDAVDAGRFERLVASGAPREALALWRGPPLDDVADEPFAGAEIRRLEELRLTALERAIEHDLDQGRHRDVIAELEALVAAEPLRENLHALLMLALYRSGRQANALAAYRAAHRRYMDELGLEPGPRLRELEQAVLRQDPSLEPPPTKPAELPTDYDARRPTAAAGRKADALVVVPDARRTSVEDEARNDLRSEPRDRDQRRLQEEPRRTRAVQPGPRSVPRPRDARIGRSLGFLGLVFVTASALVGVIALGVGILDSAPGGLPSISPEAVGVVDPQSGRIEAELKFGGRPLATVGAAGAVWIANGSRGTIARVDPDTIDIVDTVAIGGDTTAVAAADGAIWGLSSDARVVVRISPQTNAVVASVPVGHGGRAMTPAAGSLWVANALDGSVTRIDPRAARVIGTVQVGSGPAALAAGGGAVWVANEREGTVMRIDPALNRVVNRVGVGNGPSAVAFAAGSVWVANALDGTVSRIDPARDAVVATVEVGGTPRTLQAAGDTLWVGSDTTDIIVALDPATATVRRRLRVGNPVRSLAAVGDRLWVGVLAGPAAHRGGTLHIAGPLVEGEPSLDPARAYSADTWPLLSVIADGLVGYRKVGGAAGTTLVPNLARTLPPAQEGGTTYHFRMRTGLRYSDGRAVRAGDVRASIERLHRMHAPALSGYPLDVLGEESCDRRHCDLSDGIQTDDRSGTITFRLRRPNPDFMLHLAAPTYSVLPAASALHPLGRDLIGTGPYRLTSADADDRLTLVRNPRFRAWSPSAQPPGFPDRIEWHLRPSAAERKQADIRYDEPPARVLRSLAVRAPDRIHSQRDAGLQYLFLNTRVPPLDNRLARQAVATAVDRGRLARIALGGSAVPTCQALPPVLAGYQPYCPFGRARGASDPAPDLPAARELVRRSGSQGAAVTVTAPSDRPAQVRAARELARTLRSIGWHARMIEIGPLSSKSFPGSYIAAAARSSDALIGWAGWLPDLPAASKLLLPLASCARAGQATAPSFNLSGSCDPALDRLMRTAHALDTTDPARAAQLWARADRVIVKNAAIIPIAGSERHVITSARAGNLQFNPAIFTLMSQIWVR